MSYWKRLLSGEQDNVLQYWTNAENYEEIVIVDTRNSTEHKGNYGAFTSDEEKVGVYIEASEVVHHLYEDRDLLIEGSVWTDGDRTFEVIDHYPERRSTGHSYYPEGIDADVVYVEDVDSGEGDWVEEELFIDSLEVVDAGL